MKQELKNYFSQFIMLQFNCMYYELYEGIGYSDRQKIISATYNNDYKRVFEPIYKNIKLKALQQSIVITHCIWFIH